MPVVMRGRRHVHPHLYDRLAETTALDAEARLARWPSDAEDVEATIRRVRDRIRRLREFTRQRKTAPRQGGVPG